MPRALLFNHALLFLCCSIYLGIGIAFVFLQVPPGPKLTPDSYALIFIDPTTQATRLLKYLAGVMLLTGLIMLVTEWFSGIRWVPVVVLAGVAVIALSTSMLIPPYDKEVSDRLLDAGQLGTVFHQWATLNDVRILVAAVQWLALMYWFYHQAVLARADA